MDRDFIKKPTNLMERELITVSSFILEIMGREHGGGGCEMKKFISPFNFVHAQSEIRKGGKESDLISFS